jgi:hypothetical protein
MVTTTRHATPTNHHLKKFRKLPVGNMMRNLRDTWEQSTLMCGQVAAVPSLTSSPRRAEEVMIDDTRDTWSKLDWIF